MRRALLVAALCVPGGTAAADEAWIRGRLAMGARWSHFSLDDTRRLTADGPDNQNVQGNYLGSLWGLDTEQHVLPDPFAEYRIVSSFGLGASYTRQRAKTLDWQQNDPSLPPSGDGDVEIRGLQVYAFGGYPRRTRVKPYAQLGRSRYWSRFFVLPSWTRGNPGRVIQVDNTAGWFFALGARMTFWRHAGLDAFYRRSLIDQVIARSYPDVINTPNRHRTGAFPMRSKALGVGIAYAF